MIKWISKEKWKNIIYMFIVYVQAEPRKAADCGEFKTNFPDAVFKLQI